MNATSATVATARPTWFWIVSILALLWNLMGVAAFVMQVNMSPEALAALPDAQRALYETQPTWVMVMFAIAVFGGALGSLMLVLEKKLARPLLLMSLLGVLAQMSHMFLLSDTFQVMGQAAMVMPIVVIVIAAALVWFARVSARRGWIA